MSTVRLIGITKPVIDEVPTTEALLAYQARVSSSANQLNHATGPKLLAFLIKRKEWSPLEMVSMTFEVVTTRDIARQLLRHKSLNFQEHSQRYALVDDEPVLREARMQDPTDRQNSIETDDEALKTWWIVEQLIVHETAMRAYHRALDQGIAKEVARAVLPEGLTLSRLYVAGNLRSFLHYISVRAEKKTQKEHRVIAEAIKAIVIEQFPSLESVI